MMGNESEEPGPMNTLNSVILEGMIATTPKNSQDGGRTFRLQVLREGRKFHLSMVIKGALAETCGTYLGRFGAVRVVGHLLEEHGEVLVEVERVELKPPRLDVAEGKE